MDKLITKWTDMNNWAEKTEEIDEPYLNRGRTGACWAGALQSPAEQLRVEAGRSRAGARRPEQGVSCLGEEEEQGRADP